MSDSAPPPSQPPPPQQPPAANHSPYQPGPPLHAPQGPPPNFSQQQPQQPPQPPPKEGLSGCLIALIVGSVIAVVVIVAVVALVAVAANSVENAIEESAAQNATEIEDAQGCRIVDATTVELNIINTSSKQSSYDINARFLDASGSRVGGTPFFFNYVRPGEELVTQQPATPPSAAVSCEITSLSRFADESREDISSATCEITGIDEQGHFQTQIATTSNARATSDFYIAFAFVVDQIRIGNGTAALDDLEPGESARGVGVTTTGGSIEDTSCEIVYISKISS